MNRVISSVFQINGCIFAFVKHALRKLPILDKLCEYTPINVIATVLCIAISIPLYLMLTIIYAIFALYKLVAILILKLRHGENYGGILENADSMWVVESKDSYNIINMVLLFKFDQSKGDFTEFAKTFCKEKLFRARRFTSVRKFFMGYQYFVSNQVTVDDIATPMKFTNPDVCDHKALQLFIQSHCNKPLPKGNTASLEVIIGQEPVDLGNLSTIGKQYPLLIRTHHSVSDGISLLALLQDISNEKPTDFSNPNLMHENAKENGIWKMISKLFNWHAYIVTMLTKKDKNILKVPKLSGDKKIAFRIEAIPQFVKKVKSIKNSIPNGRFSDVLLTGLSGTLSNYINKKTKQIPENITLTFMAIADRRDLTLNQTELKNIFSVGSIRLPIQLVRDDDCDIINRFHKTAAEYKKFRESCDVLISHWLLRTICDALPKPLLTKLILANEVPSVGFSSVPGINKVHILGQEVASIITFVPNYCTIGVEFCLLTYDDRCQMTVIADSNIIPTEDEAQEVLDGVLEYVDALYEEVCKH